MAAAQLAAGEEDDDDSEEDEELRMPRQGVAPQRPQVPRGMAGNGTPNGLDPTREGARESHTRHVQQALSMQSRLSLGNEAVRTQLRLTLP